MAESCPYGTNLQDTTNCALINEVEREILNPFQREITAPILIDRSLFSENLQSNLVECEESTSLCKYVGFNFETDTGTRLNNMKYDIDISQVGGSKGVFTKEGQTVPTMMVAPPGYTFNVVAFTGDRTLTNLSCPRGGTYNTLRKSCRILAYATSDFGCRTGNASYHGCPAGFEPDGWSSGVLLVCDTIRYCTKPAAPFPVTVSGIQGCKDLCDAEPTCIGFNFNSILLNEPNCEMFRSITGENPAADGNGFTRHDFPTSEGKLIPNIRDSATYLGNTGRECSKMIECNSNIAQVFDTPGVESFSTTDIEVCGFCPTKTVNKISNEYYVQNEVGTTVKYTQRNDALIALKYSNIANPNTMSSSLFGLYKITSYTGNRERYIFITTSGNIIYIHAEHHDAGTIDLETGEPLTAPSFLPSFDINAVQFSFIQSDGTVAGPPSTLTQFGPENKITSIVGNGTTTTVTTLMPHGLVSTSVVFLYGDDLPILNPTIVTNTITVIANPESTDDDPKPSVSFTFTNNNINKYTGSSSAAKMFFSVSKSKYRGIPNWEIIPVDYVTNGFQFRTRSKYLKKNTSTRYTPPYTMPFFFDIHAGRPDKYSKEFADTVFILEKVQNGTTYTRYECPAVDTTRDYSSVEVHRGHTFQYENKCRVTPNTRTTTDGGLICWVTCPPGFSSSAGYPVIGGRHIGCLNPISTGEECIKDAPSTTFTVDTQYDMIFDMFTSSRIYDYPENLVFQSLLGTRYLVENKRLRKIKNAIMYYYMIKNSGIQEEKWNIVVVPSQEMIDDMPKGPNVTVPQDTGPDTDNYFYNVDALNVNPDRSLNQEKLTQKEWLNQILACPAGSYSAEGIIPCTACPANSTSTVDRKACDCSDSMYFWNNITNTCDLKSCTDNKYNLINGKEPCTECVDGSTVNANHTGCTCPAVINGTNTWQPNVCRLVCNSGYTAYGNKCIDDLPNSIAQAALDLESQRIQFVVRPTVGAPPPRATNADIQSGLEVEKQRIMHGLRSTISVGGIIPSVQSGLEVEKQRIMDGLRDRTSVGGIIPGVQSGLELEKQLIMDGLRSRTSVGGGITSDVQSGLEVEKQLIMDGLRNITSVGGGITTSDVQSVLEVEKQSIMDGLRDRTSVGGITTSDVQSGLELEKQRIMDGLRTAKTVDDSIIPVVQTQLDIMKTSASKYSVPCDPGAGYYSATGFEPCRPCRSCAAAPTNGTVSVTACTATADTRCVYGCNPGFTTTVSGSTTTCTRQCTQCTIPGQVNTTCSAATGPGTCYCPTGSLLGQYGTTAGGMYGFVTACLCAAGYFSSTKYAPCSPCTGDTYTATTGQTSCSQCKSCFAGQYVSTLCSAEVNRECTDCTSGTDFSTTTNADVCTGCSTSCGTGNYISAACTKTSDIACSSCSTTTCTTLGAIRPVCTGTERSDTTCSCPANTTETQTYLNTGALSSKKCLCNEGYAASTTGYGTACAACAKGTYTDYKGAVTCSGCASCPIVTYATTQLTRTGCGGSSPGSCTGLVCSTGFTNTGSGCTCDTGKYIRSWYETVAMKTLYACETCPTCPAGQSRVGCSGTSAGSCVNNCIYKSWSYGACSRSCGGSRLVSPVITQYPAANSPVQCPASYTDSCAISSSTCKLYMYSGQSFNGNRTGHISFNTASPVYSGYTLRSYAQMSAATTIVNDQDLRSIKVPSGMRVELFFEKNFVKLMQTINGPWEGGVSRWDDTSSMRILAINQY
jgi:hypothetical protein